MKNYLLILILLITSSFNTYDDSIKYISIITIHLPNEVCENGWAAMVNTSSNPGGPNLNIRVFYTHNNQSRVCDIPPLPKLPNTNQDYTLLGCVGGNYVISRSEYIK